MVNEKKDILNAIPINENLPTLFIDGIGVHTRKDGMYLIRLTTQLPDIIREQVRFMTSDNRLREIINTLCKGTKYYPEKPKDEVKTK